MLLRTILGLLSLLVATALVAAEPAFRTDGGDEKLPWYKLKQGEFPPEGSAHAISGELISVDHVNRSGVIRMDRSDAQRTDEYDQPLAFAMLSYGSASYHGAPAELRDIPIGTHLFGQFYAEQKDNKQVFSQCLRLEDDFSHLLSLQRQWRVDNVALNKGTITLTGVGPAENQVDARPTTFRLNSATRVWKGREFAKVADLAAGQMVLANLTVCSLKGPGRCIDIWIDAESRAAATAQQMETHRLFQREHGLAARVDEVDNRQGFVTMTVFAGFDPGLKNDFHIKDYIAVCVAEESLRTHDQINDSARGPILEIQTVTPVPGSSGFRIRFKPSELLEGFRPKRIVRIFSGGWPLDDLPREERAYDG